MMQYGQSENSVGCVLDGKILNSGFHGLNLR
jgi:hypothetical protein